MDTDKTAEQILDEGGEMLRKWPRVGIVLGAVGMVAAYIVTNWPLVEPVVSSAPMVVLSMVVCLLLGGLTNHWMVSLPLGDRVSRAEGVINRMRERERELGGEITELKVMVATLQTRLDMMSRTQGGGG